MAERLAREAPPSLFPRIAEPVRVWGGRGGGGCWARSLFLAGGWGGGAAAGPEVTAERLAVAQFSRGLGGGQGEEESGAFEGGGASERRRGLNARPWASTPARGPLCRPSPPVGRRRRRPPPSGTNASALTAVPLPSPPPPHGKTSPSRAGTVFWGGGGEGCVAGPGCAAGGL